MRRSVLSMVCVCGLLAATASASNPNRVSASKKGSLLIMSKVEIKWDVSGRVTQDTFIDLTNDFPGDVTVQLYFINGDMPLDAVEVGSPPVMIERAHPGWNNVDCEIKLTGNQPTYWSALTGSNSGDSPSCQSFTVLDPGSPPGRPDLDGAPGDRVLRGYILAWAVGLNNEDPPRFEEIRWNHLKADVVLVNYKNTAAWEYNAWSFQALGVPHGELTIGESGHLDLDGGEYDYAFNKLLLDFYATGSTALSSDDTTVQVDTDLTLHPVSVDLRQDTCGPVHVKADFDIWNQNEVRFSGTQRCIWCWDQTLLSKYTVIANHFMRANLQTDKGKARIDGVQSTVCEANPGACDEFRVCLEVFDCFFCQREVVGASDCTTNDPLLGVSAKILVFSGANSGTAYAGSNLVGQGTESATIKWDITDGSEELITGSRQSGPIDAGLNSNPRIEQAPTKASKRGR